MFSNLHLTPACLLLIASSATTLSAGVTYQAIPGAMSCDDLSANGRYICGTLDLNGDNVPDGTYIYDAATQIVTPLDPEGINASAISDDGTVVLGTIAGPNPGDPSEGSQAAIWTASSGWQSIGFLPNALNCPSKSNGYELSADGTVAVGLSWSGCLGRAFRWDANNGMQELEVLGNDRNRASVVSADGSIIAGFAQGNSTRAPAKWNGSTMSGELIGPPTNGDANGEVNGISDDGTILLGTLYTGAADGVYDAVKWVNGGDAEVIGAGSLLPGWASGAWDVANNGTIVGFDYLLGNRRAWIQPNGTGNLQLLKDWANANGANIPADTELMVAQAISANGTVIVGHAISPTNFIGFRLEIVPICPGDGNADNSVNIADLNLVLGNFGTAGPAGDINNDGAVDIVDLNLVLGNFGNACD